ncbi:NAD-P-binding protein, partial [Russula aff. rugulosa BPL654]
VYPTVNPKIHYDAQAFANKVVLITGASRGIGAQTALQYARAGASLSLVARTQSTLDASKDVILREVPSAKVLTFATDVRDVKRAAEVVAATVANFGRLDILIANAGILRPGDKPFASKDPNGWWDVFEVNIRGPYNFIHFSVPELLKTKGQVVVIASEAAQLRFPNASEYCMSKHAIIRFAEFIKIEYPDIKVFAVDPGAIQTDLLDTFGPFPPNSTAGLAASTIQYVTSGKADYLNGRFVSATWDLGEVERDWKEKIVAQNSLVSKLSLPA